MSYKFFNIFEFNLRHFKAFYLISWCPYAFASFYSAFIHPIFDLPPISPIYATIPALFAKSSLFWPVVINLLLLRKQNRKLMGGLILNNSKLLRYFQSYSFRNDIQMSDTEIQATISSTYI